MFHELSSKNQGSLVSVNIPTKNPIKTIQSTLMTTEDQIYEDIEVIIVKSAGKDRKLIIIERTRSCLAATQCKIEKFLQMNEDPKTLLKKYMHTLVSNHARQIYVVKETTEPNMKKNGLLIIPNILDTNKGWVWLKKPEKYCGEDKRRRNIIRFIRKDLSQIREVSMVC